MDIKHGRGGLAKNKNRTGAKHDDQKSTDCAYNYYVRLLHDDGCVHLNHRFTDLWELDEIFDEYHGSGQVAAVADISRLRRNEKSSIRIDVRPSDRFHDFRRHVLYRY